MGKYIFLDIDGTLYSPVINATPDSALQAIHQARANGHKVFLCTGRSLAEIVTYLDYDIDGYILAAGAKVYADKKCIYDEPISKPALASLKDMLNGMNLGYTLEGNAGAYGNPIGYEFQLNYFSHMHAGRDEKIENAMLNCSYPESEAHEDDAIYKICVYSHDGSEYPLVEEKLGKEYLMTYVVSDSEAHFYVAEITNVAINKATGIQKVLEHYHACKDDAIGIGDSDNDIPMLKYCGTSIAMGNGSQSVKDIADDITTDILDDGIMNAFKKYQLIGDEL